MCSSDLGGAALDTISFAAATGHRVIRVPSTVLAQDDSGIAVKNGINAFGKKNFVGTFAPPFGVVIDPALLETLPLRDRIAGVAEIIKVALLKAPGLFAKIAGALAVAGVSVVDAKILTLSTGMALDTFSFQDFEGEPIASESRLSRIKTRVIAALEGRLRFNQELPKVGSRLPSRVQALEVPPRVIIDNAASNRFTVIEVNARDGPALLNRLALALFLSKVTIHSAHVATYGERAVDTFYITDLLGDKISSSQRLKSIERRLLGAAANEGEWRQAA